MPTETTKPDSISAALQALEVGDLSNPQAALPRIAKDGQVVARIEAAVSTLPTRHVLYRHDSREMSFLEPESVHLVLTSPPYWTLN